ncbi:MAG: Fe-S cluster assembly protein SufD [Anaerolineae bacterium]|nr:Fe-S cluster assembly protein SufD [Anaerolineae bacterium]
MLRASDVGLNGRESAFDEYRANAFDVYRALPFPSVRDEAWRRTDISQLRPSMYEINPDDEMSEMDTVPAALLDPLAAEKHAGQIVIAGNSARVELDKDLSGRGVVFGDLERVAKSYPDLMEKICGFAVKPNEGKFAAVGSLARRGTVLYVPKNTVIEKPLHSLLWATGSKRLLLSHLIIYLEENASVTFVHESASAEDPVNSILHAGIVEIYVGNGANLRFVELQSWSRQVWNFTHERAVVMAGGTIDWIFGAVGSKLTKNFSDLVLQGAGATGRMSGFYFTDGDQHFDHDTSQNHLAPHTTSDLLFKGALRDASRSVWQGMIYVAPGAEKTDGYQSNRNLVLSKNARADSIPGLEILADDVRCTHGATIGKIDPEPLFYLASRGISKPEAERLIVEGFFDPIMERIPFDGVRTRFYQSIHSKMSPLP